MKKQTAMVLSFSALLTMAAIAPHVIWQADKSNRTPASVEQKDFFADQTNKLLVEKVTVKKDKTDKLLDQLAEDTKKKEEEKAKADKEEQAREKSKEDFRKSEIADMNKAADEAPLKELEKVEIKSTEVKKVDVDAQVSCLKEKQPADLEAQIKKLMEDKEAVMKELADLKKAKKDEPKSDDKKEDKKKEKVAKTDNTEDVLGIMSQLTGLMISQQQQQVMMMNQMFSMFQNQQPKQQSSWYSPLSDYMSPYAFNASSFAFPQYDHSNSLYGMGSEIGLNSDFGRSYSGYDRAPAQMESRHQPMFGSNFESQGTFQPQAQTQQIPHNGFDFRQGTSAMSMERVQF